MRDRMNARWFAFLAMVLTGVALWPQGMPGASQQDGLFSLVGIRLDELVMRYGLPQSVHASRGDEIWQDDVVFVYSEADFYFFQDRVWQIGLRSVYGINIGDPRAVALLVFGERAQDRGSHILFPLPAGNWPLALRINISDERVSGIFVYRSDF